MIEYDIDKIYDYMIGGSEYFNSHKWSGIAHIVNDKITCAIIWSEMTETNVWAHLRVDVPSKEFLLELIRVIFIVHKLKRITMPIYDNNKKALDLAAALGAELEAVVKQGHKDGDVLLYVLWETSPFVAKYLRKLNDST